MIRQGIKRVVAGMVDPDPRVSGYGLQYLRDNEVVVDIAEGIDIILISCW